MHVPAGAVDPAVCGFPDTDAWALPCLGFGVQVASQAALHLIVDFGDGSGVQVTVCNVSGGMMVTAYHQFGKGRLLGVRI